MAKEQRIEEIKKILTEVRSVKGKYHSPEISNEEIAHQIYDALFPQGDERHKLFNFVDDERQRQDEKWGEQNHEHLFWQSILLEEIGEIAKCLNEWRGAEPIDWSLTEELIQVIAVTVAWIECGLRNETMMLPEGGDNGK